MWLIIFWTFIAKLEPSQLKWKQFWIIEANNHLIAFGQLRNFKFTQELGSIFVVPNWRNRGIGSFLVKHLVSQAEYPIYLKCLTSKLSKFYINKGFVPVSFEEVPSSIKHKYYFSIFRKNFFKAFVMFMKYEKSN
ncbi:GNAT family N-acetyltransferase [Nostoc sp. MS1]|uniref:GNAT family N-acetyltransferase n=1 Tax=Nostoc sp. MS1 TaxID=2764711 RepID=UPI001CC4B1DA|nr:GNAT family N-acetyltransferase [Nostoc sp. MS1]BCL39634.1 hypothetical protein NSMS1_60810 [Nostoc sp. MS1]